MPWIEPTLAIPGDLYAPSTYNGEVVGNLIFLHDSLLPAGSILDFGGAAAPTGYLLCDGAAVSRTTYAALFAAIGTAFGVGNGTTTFNVPDARSRGVIGAGTGSGLSARTLAATFGEETHILSIAEMPAHHHGYANQQGGGIGSEVYANTGAGAVRDVYITDDTGGGGSHNNMQPSLVLNKIIKT